ncbi:cyclic AMP-dependent transcription factor ATF-2-like isoform X2 [Portunus trituberculatus]|uniref:cyclic AMP-dependent transcription factor ATF-2-like isoform X2 n=1 Tax=Portunus trituberculatus TaxID=210409 RepID=UPI001E1CDDE7|nr:cyclic AMP-dependent transcription factor ATF-2-like isoform X2 [Portunus trituberculatus]
MLTNSLSVMGEVDKPFGCPQPGCGMSFTNEDHLTVHRRRHEMQLTVNGEHHTPSLVKHTGFIIDQTPTPTRFLRQCEEVGLFQEISLNPFDEQFRRASLLRSHHSITESIGGSESLDTPRVLPPPADSDETISSTSRDDICGTTSTTTITSTLTTSSHAYVPPQTATTTCPASLAAARVLDVVEEEADRGDGATRRLSLNVSSAAEAGQQSSSVISTPTPVITAGPSVTQSLGAVEIGNATSVKVGGVGPASAQQPAICAAPSSVPPSPSATVLQLLLRLPNGQAIPVEIPATPVVSSSTQSGTTTNSSTTTTVSSMVASPPNPHDKSPQQSLAKMKLKQVLASSSTAARPGSSRTSRANTADRIAEMTRSRNFSGTSSTEGECDDDSVSANPTKGERKRRNSSDNEDPAEKRKKFLERNRAAAIRCREKKKKWIENLSMKYDELGSINQKLQSEVSSLRSEVAVLKSMLLQHKDCPVTLAMQGDGTLDGMNGSCGPAPLAPMLVPAPEPSLAHKPRTRSLSLPSIPSSENIPVDPLPVNLSCCVYASPPATTIVTSASSTSSPSTKVSAVPPGVLGRTGTASVSPVNLTSSLITTNQHPSPHSPATSIARIIKISSGQVSSPQTQLLAPAVVPSTLTTGGHTGKVSKIVLGQPEILTTDINLMNGAPNVIMAAAAPVSTTALPQPQLLNLTLQAPQSKASSSVLRKSN